MIQATQYYFAHTCTMYMYTCMRENSPGGHITYRAVCVSSCRCMCVCADVHVGATV